MSCLTCKQYLGPPDTRADNRSNDRNLPHSLPLPHIHTHTQDTRLSGKWQSSGGRQGVLFTLALATSCLRRFTPNCLVNRNSFHPQERHIIPQVRYKLWSRYFRGNTAFWSWLWWCALRGKKTTTTGFLPRRSLNQKHGIIIFFPALQFRIHNCRKLRVGSMLIYCFIMMHCEKKEHKITFTFHSRY